MIIRKTTTSQTGYIFNTVFLILLLILILQSQITYAQKSDIGVVSSDLPKFGSTIPPNTEFSAIASFTNYGDDTVLSVPVRFEVISESGSNIFVSDRVISGIKPSQKVTASFDNVKGGLKPGKYKIRISEFCLDDTNVTNNMIEGTLFINWRLTDLMYTEHAENTANLLTDGRVLITGGYTESKIISTNEIFNPDGKSGKGTWTNTGTMHIIRKLFTSTTLNSGNVLVTGGETDSSLTKTAEIFYPDSNSGSGAWSFTDSMLTKRSNHTATLLVDGKVLVTGGLTLNGVTADCEEFDPAGNGGKGSWSQVNPMHVARYNQTATLLSDGRVLVTGGINSSGDSISICEIFNPMSNNGKGSWELTAPMNYVMSGHKAVLLHSGKVLVISSNGSEIYDTTNGGIWTNTPTMINPARNDFAASLLADGRVLVEGGGSKDCEFFYPDSNNGIGVWKEAPSMGLSRSGFTSTKLLNGKILVAGGFTYHNSYKIYLSAAEIFDTTTFDTVISPNHLAITEISPDIKLVGQPFKVLVESEDSTGRAQNVDTATTVVLSISKGTGKLSGNLTGTIMPGENTIVFSRLTYSKADTGVQITCSVKQGMHLLPGTTSSLKFIGVPEKIVTAFPNNNSLVTTDSVNIKWFKSNDYPTKYWLELSNNLLFTNAVIDSNLIDTTATFAVPDNSTLWWRVRADNAAGWGKFSDTKNFFTSIPPSSPKGLEATAGLTSLVLTWNRNRESDISKYLIYTGSKPDSLALTDSTSSSIDTSITYSNLTTGNKYYYRIIAVDDSANKSDSSNIIYGEPNYFTDANSFKRKRMDLLMLPGETMTRTGT